MLSVNVTQFRSEILVENSIKFRIGHLGWTRKLNNMQLQKDEIRFIKFLSLQKS